MQGKLGGRVALVTGAASGIGRTIAIQLAGEGVAVSVVDMNMEGARAVVREIKGSNGKAIAIKCDVSKEKQVNRAVKVTEERLGNVGILVNCAGTAGYGFLADMTTEEWLRMFEIHCNGTFFFSRAVINSMKSGDRIINISSIDGVQAQVFASGYAAAKGAIISLTSSLALEVAHRGITVNAIAPGHIRTPMGEMLIYFAPDFDKEIPAQRFGEPEDIAELAVFLASPGAGYITGQVIVVDGGLTLANPINRFTAKMMGLP
jgi:3-oxoacyl-[acyl-carrier protein] reductase